MTDLEQFRRHAVAFVLAAGTLLLAVFAATAKLFPATGSMGFARLGSAESSDSEDSLFEEFYRKSQRSCRAAMDGESTGPAMRFVQEENVGEGEDSRPVTALARDAVPLRVVSVTQSLLCRRHRGEPKEAWAAMRSARATGPFRGFEENRFALRLTNLELRSAVSGEYAAVAVSNAADARADFEDCRRAAIGALLTGDANGAVRWAERALRDWPNRGIGYGDAYLLLMLAYAARGDTDQVMAMLPAFQDTYSDWLYGERYLPDVEAVERYYPDAPLLKVIRGYQLALLRDDGAAAAVLRQALASKALARQARSPVMRRLRQLLEERPR